MFLKSQIARLEPLFSRRRAAVAAPAPTADAGEEEGRVRIDIVFSDVAWRMTLIADDGTEDVRTGDLFEAAALEPDSGGAAAGLRAALRALAPGERTLAREVSLYPISPEIALYDSRSLRAFSGDLGDFRNIARDLAGVADCVFDRAPFKAAGEDGRLIAVSDADLTRRCIAILGDLAPRLVRIAPASAGWASVAPSDRASAKLHIGVRSSLLVCVDPARGVVSARSAPVGLAHFVDMIAHANSLPKSEAAREMAARDMIARAAAAGVDGPLAALTRLVRDSIDYIVDSRLSEPPGSVVVFGGHAAASGLCALLSERLNLNFTPDAPAPIAVATDMNLLRSTEGPLFSEGARAFRFVEDRFVAEEPDNRKLARAAKKAEPPAARSRLSPKVFGVDLSPRRLAVLGAGAALALGFLLFDQAFAPVGEAHARAASQYEGSLQRAAALNAQIRTLRSNARRDALLAGAADKILWAEKFVSIAGALPTGLRLTDASIAAQDRRVGQVDVVATKLVLRGVASSVGQRRLQDIARFIETLARDEAFMRDFREVTFAGLGGEGASAVFEVHAWYDENKRQADAAKTASADPGANPLAAATAATAARQAFAPGILGGGEK